MTEQPKLAREEILALLEDLSDELEAQGVQAEMFVVGGAAIALAYNKRRITADVDAIFEPKEVVYAAAARVAGRHPGVPADWLNDGVKGFCQARTATPSSRSRPQALWCALRHLNTSSPSRCRLRGWTETSTTSGSSRGCAVRPRRTESCRSPRVCSATRTWRQRRNT